MTKDKKDRRDTYTPPSIPANLEIISFLVKEFQRDVKTMERTLVSLSNNLIGMESEIEHLKDSDEKILNEMHEENKKIWKELEEIRKYQLACPARTNIKAVNARLKVLEKNDRDDLKERADQTGSVVIPNQIPIPPPVSIEKTFWKNIKIFIWIGGALITGAAFGGYMISQMLTGG